jgi:hypothetical protein
MSTSPSDAPAPKRLATALCLISTVAALGSSVAQTLPDEPVVRSSGGLPAHVVGLFRQPVAFQQSVDGDYYVLDRRGQSVYRITPTGEAEKIVQIGPEQGRLLGATSLHVGPSGRFVVADAPGGRERVQIFEPDGTPIGRFTLPGRAAPRITLGNAVLNGVGSLQFTDRSIVMNQPELGGLVTEFGLTGHPFRTFGVFRRTGHEDDRDVNLSLNSGIPLVDPTGGYYFVFQAGVPVFRKYDRSGTLLFERHIEGPELDSIIAALPTTWPRRADERGREFPVITPTVRTAAVDRLGHLWVGLTGPLVYVYDRSGEKTRTVRLQAAGMIQPDSLSFSRTNSLLVTPGCYEFSVW